MSEEEGQPAACDVSRKTLQGGGCDAPQMTAVKIGSAVSRNCLRNLSTSPISPTKIDLCCAHL
jgi:hypothetical protein